MPLSALSGMKGLEALNLTGRAVTGSLGALRGADSLASLHLDAGGLQGSLAALGGLTQLEVLDLSALPPGDPRRDGGTAWEKSSPGILGDRRYRVPGGGSDPRTGLSGGLGPLASLLRLRFLRIEGTRVGGDLTALRNLTQLRELHIGSNCLSGDLVPLQGLLKLRALTIPGRFPWAGGARPCNGTAGLEGSLLPVSSLRNLEVLALPWNSLEGDISALRGLSLLTTLSLNENKLAGDLSSVSNLTLLQTLQLRGPPCLPSNPGTFTITGVLLYWCNDTAPPGGDPAGEVEALPGTKMGGDMNSSEAAISNKITGPVSAIQNMTALKHVDLSFTDIDGSIDDAVRGTPLLEHLDVSWSYIYSRDGLSSLSDLTGLQRLEAGMTGLAGNFSSLSGLTSLTHLDFDRNLLIGGNMSDLGALTKLRSLNLKTTNVTGDPNVVAAMTELTALGIIRLADPSCEAFSPVCGLYPQLSSDSLAKLPDLEHLVVENVQKGEGAGVDFRNLSKLRTLSCRKCSAEGNLSELIGEDPDLEALHLSGNPLHGDFSYLANFPELSSLDLSSSVMDGPDLWPLQNLSKLTHLDLALSNVAGSLEPLRNLPLNLLILDNNFLTGSVQPLRYLTKLRELSLANNSLSGNIASFSGLVQLTRLNAEENSLGGDVAALANLTKLRSLIIDGERVGSGMVSGNLSFVRDMSGLRTLSMAGQGLSGGLEGLENLTAISYLRAGGNNLNGTLEPLSNLTDLVVLGLANNSMTALGGWNVPASLRVLNLEGNLLEEDILELQAALPFDLVSLDMASNSLSGDLGIFVERIKKTELLYLDISANPNITGKVNVDDLNYFQQARLETPSTVLSRMTVSSIPFSKTAQKLKIDQAEYVALNHKPRLTMTKSGKGERPCGNGGRFTDSRGLQQLTFKVQESDKFIRICPTKLGPDEKRDITSVWEPYSSIGAIEQGTARAQRYVQNLTGTFSFNRPLLGEDASSVNFVFGKLFREDGFAYFEDTPYAQEMFPDGIMQKHFVAYDVDVKMDKCGSVCVHDKSVSWVYYLEGGPLLLQPYVSLAAEGYTAQSFRAEDGPPAWRGRKRPESLSPHWPDILVDSHCIIDMSAVNKCLDENGLKRGVGAVISVKVHVKGAFQAFRVPESRNYEPSQELLTWANTTDYLTYTTPASISVQRAVTAEAYGLIAGVFVAVFTVVLAVAVVLLRRWQKQRTLQRLEMAKDLLQNSLLSSTTPAHKIGRDMCLVSTDIEKSTFLRVRSLKAYNDAMQVHHNLLRQTLLAHGGLELLCEGDGFILGFKSVSRGTAFCCEFQQRLQLVAWSPATWAVFEAVYGEADSALPVAAGPHRCWGAAKLPGFLRRRRAAPGRSEAFNGLRVRCGIHWVPAATYELHQRGPNIYSVSGPGYELARRIGDVGHGGQTILSREAQRLLLDDLPGAKYPILTDLGVHRLFGATVEEAPMNLYQVAPSVGGVRLRKFPAIRTAEMVEEPRPGLCRPVLAAHDGCGDADEGAGSGAGSNSTFTLVGVYVSEQKSFKEAAERSRIPEGDWVHVREVVADMQRKFWGWRVEVEDGLEALQLSHASGVFTGDSVGGDGAILGLSQPGCAGIDVGQVLALSQDFRDQVAAKQAWLLAFEDAQDALRFCLASSVELAYSPWKAQAWKGGSAASTPDGAPLWNGPALGFTLHTVQRDASCRASLPERDEWIARRSLRGSQGIMGIRVGAGLLEMLGSIQAISANCRVVLSKSTWVCLNADVGGQPAHYGKAVLEHLGRVHITSLSRSWEAYQMLPVQLAARTRHFLPLLEASPAGRLTLLSPGARDAPTFSRDLTFVFTQWFSPSEHDLRGLASLRGADDCPVADVMAEVQRVGGECHAAMADVCTDLEGYIVEEIGTCEYLLAFPNPASAVRFAFLVEFGLWEAVSRSTPLERAGLADLRPLAPSEGWAPRSGAGGAGEGFTGFLAAGVACVGTSSAPDSYSRKWSSVETNRIRTRLKRLARLTSNGGTRVFADVHPVTGRRTYSTPAMNKAARAKALARGGQVLLADLAPEASAAPGSGSAENSSLDSLTLATGGEPSGSASAVSAKSDESAPEGTRKAVRGSPLPAALYVLTGQGQGHAFLLPLGRRSLRGFHAEVGLAELTAELPAPGKAPPGTAAPTPPGPEGRAGSGGSGPVSPARTLAPPRPAAWANWRPKSLAGPSAASVAAPRALDAAD